MEFSDLVPLVQFIILLLCYLYPCLVDFDWLLRFKIGLGIYLRTIYIRRLVSIISRCIL